MGSELAGMCYGFNLESSGFQVTGFVLQGIKSALPRSGCFTSQAFNTLSTRGLRFGSFRKLGVRYVGVLVIRILLFRVLY